MVCCGGLEGETKTMSGHDHLIIHRYIGGIWGIWGGTTNLLTKAEEAAGEGRSYLNAEL
jgi:hypothetical protein